MSFAPRHEMPGMDMDMGGDSGSSDSSSGHDSMPSMVMAMVFQTQRSTPLYANSWTPHSAGAYAGTCIFLVILAIVARLLLAVKSYKEARWLERDENRRYVAVNGKVPLAERLARDPNAKGMTVVSENGTEENVIMVASKTCAARPWRFSVEPVRAVMDTLIVGVGYLLMLAVMTMNVGYFLSVLAGVFIGSLTVGRYSSVPSH